MNSCRSASSDQVSGRADESSSSSFPVITTAEEPLLPEHAVRLLRASARLIHMIKKLRQKTQCEAAALGNPLLDGALPLWATDGAAGLVAARSRTDPAASWPRHRFTEVSSRGEGTTGPHPPTATARTAPTALTETLVPRRPRSLRHPLRQDQSSPAIHREPLPADCPCASARPQLRGQSPGCRCSPRPEQPRPAGSCPPRRSRR